MLQDLNIEQSVAGLLILNPQLFNSIGSEFNSSYFSDSELSNLYSEMFTMHMNRKHIDKNILQNKGFEAEIIDGLVKSGYNANINSFNVYINLLKDLKMKRMLFAFCDKYKPLIDCSDNMKDLSASMQNELFSIVKKAVDFDMRHVSDVIQEVCDEVESAMITDISKEQLLSGFATIDNFIRMQRGNVIVIAARPSQGKSALALNIVKNMAGNNKISAFFGLEMSDTENVKRLLASYGDVKLNKLTKMETLFGDNYTAGKLVKNAEQASKLNMYIDSSPRLTVVDIRSKLSTLQSMAGHIDCVVLDYLQLMTPIDGESSEKKIANMSREIKILAGEFNCVFIVLSQLNRQCEARDDKKPILSDLRDSGAIEQDADAVLMLMRPSFYNRNTVNIESNEISVDNNHVWIGIRKNRAGKTGETLLRFDGEFARFRDDSNYGEEIRKAEALLEY